MRACPGHCAMHHECPCADKLERHPTGNVANTPGTTTSAKAVPGLQLSEAIRAIEVTIHGDIVDLGPAGALRRSMVRADWGPAVLDAMRRR